MGNEQAKIEIYTVDWCPFCRRTKSFLKSKELSYKEYSVGEDEEKKREMQERSGGEKNVPQIFINDNHIGGYDDLIEMDAAGELTELLDLPKPIDFSQIWDVVIVGAGPAGLSAAIYAARKGLEVLVLSIAMGGQVIETDDIDNYIGFSSTDGFELMDAFFKHSQQYDIDIQLGIRVEEITSEEELKLIKTDRNEIKSKSIIIASGTHKRELGVDGEKELKGKGVHYCAICDGFLYAGQEVAVVGGGNSGLEACLDLAKMDSQVNLIEIADQLMGDKVLQDKVKSNELIDIYTSNNVMKIKGEEKVNSVEIRDNDTGKVRELDVDAVFIEIGLIPNSGFVSDLLATNDRDEIIIDSNNKTDVEGIWGAGDVTDIKDKQIVVAVAEGARAALRVNEYLNELDVESSDH